ncbi:MAG TPA: ABC transporter substrate-binding protein [Actinomycetota bacterium]|nr:ABC transporter substrate-binding protein [Actinomycetota bacterium]
MTIDAKAGTVSRALAPAVALALVVLAACGDDGGLQRTSDEGGRARTVRVADGFETDVDEGLSGTIRLAHGFGITYAPIQLARELQVFEKKYPNVEVKWFEIASTSDQSAAMLAGDLDFPACGADPIVVSWDAGVDWKVVQMVSSFDAWLMVRPDGPDSVFDLVGTDMSIAPGPRTGQYYAVQKLLADDGRDPKALDRNWVDLAHPDAAQALLGGQLDAHFASTDFALRLQEEGMKKISSFSEAYDGELYPLGVCALSSFEQKHPELVRAVADIFRQTVEWMNDNPSEAAKLLARATRDSDQPVPASDFEAYLDSGIFHAITSDAGLRHHAELLTELGAIDKRYTGAEDFYFYPEEAGSNW